MCRPVVQSEEVCPNRPIQPTVSEFEQEESRIEVDTDKSANIPIPKAGDTDAIHTSNGVPCKAAVLDEGAADSTEGSLAASPSAGTQYKTISVAVSSRQSAGYDATQINSRAAISSESGSQRFGGGGKPAMVYMMNLDEHDFIDSEHRQLRRRAGLYIQGLYNAPLALVVVKKTGCPAVLLESREGLTVLKRTRRHGSSEAYVVAQKLHKI
ncbi:hypothetical protein R3P38DRAFT_2793138 [Favolaschia claudopus]|uniref:Uncharacterized protein n=1 Tax=Favolaschia claudopus TaxID=2862362 RepID=A0AAW0ACS9_9AGAR